MKKLALVALLALAPLAETLAVDPPAQEQQLIALAKEIQAQQALIAANQAKIEASLATVTEAVRVARIYSSRGGR